MRAKSIYGNEVQFSELFDLLTLEDLKEKCKGSEPAKLGFNNKDSINYGRTTLGSAGLQLALGEYSNAYFNLDISKDTTANIHKAVKNLHRFRYVQGGCTDGTDMYYILLRKEDVKINGVDIKKEIDALIVKVFRRKLKDGNYVWYISDRYMNNVCNCYRESGWTDKSAYYKRCFDYMNGLNGMDRHFCHGGDLTYVQDLKIKGNTKDGVILCPNDRNVYVINPYNLNIIKKEINLYGLKDGAKVSALAYYSNTKRLVFLYKKNQNGNRNRNIGIYNLKTPLSTVISESTSSIKVELVKDCTMSSSLSNTLNVGQGIECDGKYIYLTRTYFSDSDERDRKINAVMVMDWNYGYHGFVKMNHVTEKNDDSNYFEIENIYRFATQDTIYLYVAFIKSKGNHAVIKRIGLPKSSIN